jgi:hypothetical protein
MTAVWIIIIVGVIALLQSFYYNKRGLKNVVYTRCFNKERVFAGEKAELVEVLTIISLSLSPGSVLNHVFPLICVLSSRITLVLLWTGFTRAFSSWAVIQKLPGGMK